MLEVAVGAGLHGPAADSLKIDPLQLSPLLFRFAVFPLGHTPEQPGRELQLADVKQVRHRPNRSASMATCTCNTQQAAKGSINRQCRSAMPMVMGAEQWPPRAAMHMSEKRDKQQQTTLINRLVHVELCMHDPITTSVKHSIQLSGTTICF